MVNLKLSLGKLYGRHHDHCEVSVSQMTTDMFLLLKSQSGPFPIYDLSSGP